MAITGKGKVTVAGLSGSPTTRVNLGLGITWDDNGEYTEQMHQVSANYRREILAVALTAMSAELPVLVEAESKLANSEVHMLWVALAI
jgi:hypothetical protein